MCPAVDDKQAWARGYVNKSFLKEHFSIGYSSLCYYQVVMFTFKNVDHECGMAQGVEGRPTKFKQI